MGYGRTSGKQQTELRVAHSIQRIKCSFSIDAGRYTFSTISAKQSFISNPRFRFDFNLDNVDDQRGLEVNFGTNKFHPIFASGEPVFLVSNIEEDESDDNVAIVSVKLEMYFDYVVSAEKLRKWIEDDGSGWHYTGRIECIGEDGLMDADREGYEFDF